MITSKDIKKGLVPYFRFDRQMAYVCTECDLGSSLRKGGNIIDVVAADKNKLIDVEIKISVQDFKNDFNKSKHDHYAGRDINKSYSRTKAVVPNYFYFCVPFHLMDFAKDYLKNYPNYGLIIYYDKHLIKVEKKAKKLHKDPPSQDTFFRIVKRMSSEIANFHQ